MKKVGNHCTRLYSYNTHTSHNHAIFNILELYTLHTRNNKRRQLHMHINHYNISLVQWLGVSININPNS